MDRYRSNKYAGEKNWLTTSPMGKYTAYPRDLPPSRGGGSRVPYVLCGATVSKLFA